MRHLTFLASTVVYNLHMYDDCAFNFLLVDGAIARLGREAAANARWIVSFTKPCPNCKLVSGNGAIITSSLPHHCTQFSNTEE